MSTHARLALGVALLLTVLAAVQWSIGWPQLLAPWRSLDPLALALAAVLTLLSYLARTLRLYDYFLPATAGGLGACLKLTLLHNLLNNLLPMRSGELSFPLLLHRYFAVPLPRSLAALLWFRLMDLYALGLIALMAIGDHWLPAGWLAPLAVAWLALPWLLLTVQERLLPRVARRLPEHWRARLAQARTGLPRTPVALMRAWFWTLFNWVVKLAVFAWILILFAPLLSPAVALLGAIGGDLTSVLPVHGVAGAGTYEAGVLAALLPFGVPAVQALTAAVNLHLFMLGLSLAGGALALALRHDVPTAGMLHHG